jgi:cytochrome c oxidase subunit 2
VGVSRQRARRVGLRAAVALCGVALTMLAGCSAETTGQLKRLGLPEGATEQAPAIGDLWIGTWIAAGTIGIAVWGLIGWAALRYKTNHNEMPRQNRYNLPMEIFYTVAPFVVILAQDTVTRNPDPDLTVDVVGQKWSWTFNYEAADVPGVGTDVWEAGTINIAPTLYLPVNKTVRFNLSSPDVNHSFWVPSFYEKMDVIPGRDNHFTVTPNREGVYAGKCAELCGTYHFAMRFEVHVVSEQEYQAHLKTLADRGQTGKIKGAAIPNPVGEPGNTSNPDTSDGEAPAGVQGGTR